MDPASRVGRVSGPGRSPTRRFWAHPEHRQVAVVVVLVDGDRPEGRAPSDRTNTKGRESVDLKGQTRSVVPSRLQSRTG